VLQVGIFSFLLGGLGYSLIQEWDAVGRRRREATESRAKRESALMSLATKQTSEEADNDREFFNSCKIKDLYDGIADDMKYIMEDSWKQGMEEGYASDSVWRGILKDLWLSKKGKIFLFVDPPILSFSDVRMRRVIERNLREFYFEYESKFLFKTIGFGRDGLPMGAAPAQCLYSDRHVDGGPPVAGYVAVLR
jgi:hypothetical protein